MPLWSLDHRVFAYDTFVMTGGSIVNTQREFRRHFNIGRHGDIPTSRTIRRWVTSLRSTGKLTNKKPPGPRRSARTPENVDRVRQAIQRSPGRSARKHASELRLSDRTVRRILHVDLGLHPYKIMLVQEINAGDYAQRLAFARNMLQLFEEHDDAVIMMSDEAHFHLNGTVNKQNCRYWASDNPRALHQRPLHSPKVTVWCAVTKECVIGPYFFEENGVTVTVNSHRYIEMINNFFIPELHVRGMNTRTVWFQQDGATAHTARASMDLVRALFNNHVISRFGDVPWPPRSPDLSTCDFFLWGFLKSRVYESKPRTLEELKTSIRQTIDKIQPEMLERVETNFRERLEICIRKNGHHLRDIIFRT